jgi:spermidine/putrescine transport system substrate-binding protein
MFDYFIEKDWVMKASRRTFVAGASATIAAPFILKSHDALSSSGTVRVFAWQDHIQKNIAEAFEKATGIKLELTTYGSNEEAESIVRANGGTGFDVIFPSITNLYEYQSPDAPNGLYLRQLDMSKVNVGDIIPSFMRDSISMGATYKGKQALLPLNWGTEGMTLDRSKMNISDTDLSYGDMFKPEAKGSVALRQKSIMIGAALYLDAVGEVPSNRMMDVYKSEEEARRVWGAATKFVLEHKENFGAFWNNATEATSAFTDAGCSIGMTWDTTGLLLNRENKNIVYRAPKEGSLAWVDSMGMLSGAENVDQAYSFINFMLTPQAGGMLVNNTGYNSAVTGAENYASDEYKRQYKDVYREDVVSNFWWWPAMVPHFTPVRNEFVEIITNA